MNLKLYCEEKGLDYNVVKIVKLIFDTKEENLIETLFSNFLNKEISDLLRIEMIEERDGELVLKSPYEKIQIVENTTALFKKYFNGLFTKGLTVNGSPSNPCSFAAIITNKTAQDSFYRLMHSVDDLDIDKLIDATINYYTDTEYKVKLDKFLDEVALSSYNSYSTKKSNKYQGLR